MKKIVLVIPVYNEEKILENSVTKLLDYFKNNIKYDWKIVIANNASIDRTKEIANKLAKSNKKIIAFHLNEKGRGRALKKAWAAFEADAAGYCDVDLATDKSYLKELFDSILFEDYDIAIGNRYLKKSNSKRTIARLIYSKIYIRLVKILFRTKLTDFQCGFKAINKKVIKTLLPRIKNNEWFFDSELLLKAENDGLKIKQIPVKWAEMRVKESKVNILDTGLKYIWQIINLKFDLLKKMKK